MGKSFKKYSDVIRSTLIWNAIIPIMGFSILAFLMLFIIARKLIINENININEKVSYYVNDNMIEYNNFIKMLAKDEILVNVIEGRNKTENAYEILYKFINKRSVKSNFYIFDSNGEMVLSNKKDKPIYSYKNENLFMWGLFSRMRGKSDEVITMVNNGGTSAYGYGVLSIGKAIKDNEEIVGYVVFDLKEEDIFNLITGHTTSDIIITDKYNIVAATNNKYSDQLYRLKIEYRNKSGSLNIENNDYFINIKNMDNNNIYIYTITSLEFFNKGFLIGGAFLMIIFISIFIAMLYFTKKISEEKTVSIDEIIKGIKSVQDGNLDTKLNIESEDEFSIIANAYNDMLKDIKNLIETNKQEVALRMKSEIKELESQFNPHFLYNTLETIRVMIKFDKDVASKVIVNLSTLLRYGVNNTLNIVMLRDDIEYIKNYLEILKLRFEDNFHFEIKIQEEALDINVPKLILQPIIENSIKYGFEKMERLEIKITSEIYNDKLEIKIIDNGIGISLERMEYINGLLNKSYNNTENIGIYNVHKRIKLLYGDDYGLKIESKENIGTTVRILLPNN